MNQVEVREEVSYTRKKTDKKAKAKRLLLPTHLPREEEIIIGEGIEEADEKIEEKVTEVLEYTPGKLWVKKPFDLSTSIKKRSK